MKPFVLGVDLDGVCGDYGEALRQVVAAERGLEPDELPVARSWNFHEWGLDAESFMDIHDKAVVDHRIFATMPVLDGVSEVLWRLSDAGVWIRIVTHRLCQNWSHAVSVSDTVEWLDQHRIPYRDLCFIGDKPDLGADLFVDDAPHNIDALRSAGKAAVVFHQPYNEDVPGPRARDWFEVERLAHESMAAQSRPVVATLPGLDAGGERLDSRVR